MLSATSNAVWNVRNNGKQGRFVHMLVLYYSLITPGDKFGFDVEGG